MQTTESAMGQSAPGGGFETLDASSVDPDPTRQFDAWYQQALAAALIEPDAATVATATSAGVPSARMVLLRGYDARGFVFYTNYHSRKAREIVENPRASMVLWWAPLGKQVRIRGPVELVSAEESDAYFRQRPRGHQLSAWASSQSEVVESRAALERQMQELDERFKGVAVPRPPHWGGYRIVPEEIEFWLHRLDRMHDRIRYRRRSDGGWTIERLSP
jgi:pyridoxamine 5'-phosphate oxidase